MINKHFPLVLGDSIKTVSMTFVQLLTTTLVSIILARSLGPTILGQFIYLQIICSTSALLINPGLYASVNYHLSSKTYTVQQVWSTLLLFSLILSIFGSAVAIVLYAVTSGDPIVGDSIFIYVITLTTFQIFLANYSGVMYGSRKTNQVTTVNSLLSLGYFLTILYLVIDRVPLDLYLVAAIYCAYQGLNCLGLLLLSRPSKVGKIEVTVARNLTRFGLAVYPGRIANFFNYRFDTYIINMFLGSSALGIYSVAVSLAELLWQVPNAVNLIMLPNLLKDDSEIAIKRTINVSQLISLMMLSLALFLALFSHMIITILFGTEFLNARSPFLVLLPGVAFFAITKIIEPFFQSKKRPGIPSKVALIGLVVNITLNLVLIPLFGLTGAALSSLVSYTLQVLLFSVEWQKEAHIPWWILFIPKMVRLSDWA